MKMHRSTPPPLPPHSTRPPPPPPRCVAPPPVPPKSTRPAPAAEKEYKYLTPNQVSSFLTNGFVTIPGAFSAQKAAEWTTNLWPRLGYNPADRSTWERERIHMANTHREHVSTFSPATWDAMRDILGGEERIDVENATWGDSFIVNLGVPGSEPIPKGGKQDPKKLWDWHVDGDFFVHFLDSREQALLVIPVFEDIEEGGGGTMVAPESVGIISKYLYDHPEGVMPNFSDEEGWFVKQAKKCQHFVEITGKKGDVVLMHPFMLHSASRNLRRTPRVITNPRIGMRKPFEFGREGGELNLVERKTLMELGVEKLEWKITGERKPVIPERVRKQKEEAEREKRAQNA